MTSISVDEKFAARLAERAERGGVSGDDLAEQANVQARDADELLDDGFGR